MAPARAPPSAQPAPASAFNSSNTTFTPAQLNKLLDTLALKAELNPGQRLRFDRVRLEEYLQSPQWRQRRQAQLEQLRQRRNSRAGGEAAGNGTRGILIVAGGKDLLANALVSVRVLREALNCSLPIEVGSLQGRHRPPWCL